VAVYPCDSQAGAAAVNCLAGLDIGTHNPRRTVLAPYLVGRRVHLNPVWGHVHGKLL
jgi:hypothetical protein